MTQLKWLLLALFMAGYLIIGGVIFMVIEQENEIQQNADFSVFRKDIQDILFKLDLQLYRNDTPKSTVESITSAKEDAISRIAERCGCPDFLDGNGTDEIVLRWTFYNSVFFAFTAVTTIGYGHLTPTTCFSRLFTIVFALFGIPLNGILVSGLSNYFARKLITVHKRNKIVTSETHKGCKLGLDYYCAPRLAFVFDIFFYLIPGLLIFVIVPASFFVILEGWTFVDSVYFSFITLTTIGFGDYVAAMDDGKDVWIWAYKIIIIIWIIFGMGYFVMILSFITKGMTHKAVRRQIKKRLRKVKITKQKLVRDVDYMRKVLNEVYLLKIRPVYQDEDGEHVETSGCRLSVRSISEPNIYENLTGKMYLEEIEKKELRRSRSEADLDQIDHIMQEVVDLPRDLLASVVNIIQDNLIKIVEGVDENDLDEVEYLEEIECLDENCQSEPSFECGKCSDKPHNEEMPYYNNAMQNEKLKEIIVQPQPSIPVMNGNKCQARANCNEEEGIRQICHRLSLSKMDPTPSHLRKHSQRISGYPLRRVSEFIIRNQPTNETPEYIYDASDLRRSRKISNLNRKISQFNFHPGLEKHVSETNLPWKGTLHLHQQNIELSSEQAASRRVSKSPFYNTIEENHQNRIKRTRAGSLPNGTHLSRFNYNYPFCHRRNSRKSSRLLFDDRNVKWS